MRKVIASTDVEVICFFYQNSHGKNHNMKATGDVEVMVNVRDGTMIVTTMDMWNFEQHLAVSKLEDKSHNTAHVQRDKKLL
jgi:phenylpropionate dioxygenase-like ring-hydroxylating dioxygenase large terminal subunit